MKIKTITSGNSRSFDEMVNEAMSAGYQLVRRDVLVNSARADDSILYAELVLLDPPAKDKGFDPVKALHIVKAACLDQPRCEVCPLADWCHQLCAGGDPTDWELPEVEG